MRTYVRAFEDFIMFISITSKTDIVMRKTVEPLKPSVRVAVNSDYPNTTKGKVSNSAPVNRQWLTDFIKTLTNWLTRCCTES